MNSNDPWWKRICRIPKSWWLRILVVLIALFPLYYGVGALIISTVDDDIAFSPAAMGETPEKTAKSSSAVTMIAALVEREVDVNGWVANDLFFMPGSILDNMPNFQMGMVAALSRVVVEMGDQLGRTRGSSSIDPDLDKAAGLLKFPGTVNIFNFSTSWMPTTPAESQYRAAIVALRSYNQRLMQGDAIFEKRSDNLQALLDRISKDLGSLSGTLEEQLNNRTWVLLDTRSDDVFYSVKGRVYGYYMVLKAIGEDFSALLAERELTQSWQQLLGSMEEAATLRPWIVLNGAPDALATPSHLASTGFYLLRARTQLGEISNVLLK